MSAWEDYRKSLLTVNWCLNKLQNDKNGFYYPHHPDRKNVSPACICALKNWIEYYASSNPAFLQFKDTVIEDYSSPNTSPETFQKPIYFELKAFLEKELADLESYEI